MKKTIFMFLFLFTSVLSAYSANFYAIGLNNTNEHWSYFSSKAVSVKIDNYGGFTKVEIQGRYRMICTRWSCPSSQPFQFVARFSLVAGAVVTSAAVYQNNEWIEAKPVDVLTAEDIYNATGKSDTRLMMRRRVKRTYWGSEQTDYEFRLSPIDKNHDFIFKIVYLVKNKPSLWRLRTALNLREFLAGDIHYLPVSFTFSDIDRPESTPTFIYGISQNTPFIQQEDGVWKATVTGRFIRYSGPGIAWWRPFFDLSELRVFRNEDGKFYHLMLPPPLTTNPGQRKPKNVLILYDLADAIPSQFMRSFLINEFKVMAVSGLSDLDSINVLLTDFIPMTLRNHFIPATNENVDILFKEVKQAPQPHLSTLPQLLRAAKDFFNRENRAGEIWIISSATKHSQPISVANEIIDLSLRRIKKPVVIKVFDCSRTDYYNRVYINGKTYYGNQYLYQNLARLSKGAVLQAQSKATWNLRDGLVNVFFPSVEAVEVDALPAGGYHESVFLLNDGRTHFPISWPFMELGRYEGDMPFALDYFGKVDGKFYHSQVTNSTPVETPGRDILAMMWYAYHVENQLKQPQSYNLIEEIGRTAVKYHFLSPYNGFIIPGASGSMGFQRLVKNDTEQQDEEIPRTLPGEFALTVYPNPFNPSTTVRVEFANESNQKKAEIKIFNSLGRLIKSMKLPLNPGTSVLRFQWNGDGDDRSIVPSGIYLISVRIGQLRKMVKVTLLK
ncbi:MAG TPA: T9SS type A sorting domain-containing protein [Bacteroidetes bacterium]|nr:T9SS type A sorting domain-containing protein [Bacteroidota bacterium]